MILGRRWQTGVRGTCGGRGAREVRVARMARAWSAWTAWRAWRTRRAVLLLANARLANRGAATRPCEALGEILRRLISLGGVFS